MFKENMCILQRSLFSIEAQLSKKSLLELRNSNEYAFYKEIFTQINEKDFEVLYSSISSRPNTSVNILVSALILKFSRGWSFDELVSSITFNLLTRIALGLNNLYKTPFCRATIFNFQNRIASHYNETGINLFEKVFDSLTKSQLKKLEIKSNIQRTDSFLLCSNVCRYSRLQLLLEIILRLYKKLDKIDQEKLSTRYPYKYGKSSSKHLYGLTKESLPKEFIKIAEIYSFIMSNFYEKYSEQSIFKKYFRVYEDHFKVVEGQLKLKTNSELHSGMLQSPDDLDATYRKKGNKSSIGFKGQLSESCHPSNQLNLILDVVSSKNNVDDSKLENQRLEIRKKKTPYFSEEHTDGAYGSECNDKLFKSLSITQVQTAIRGRKIDVKQVELEIVPTSSGNYKVKCPYQETICIKTKKGYRGNFELSKCNKCKEQDNCPTKTTNKYRVYYFKESKYLKDKRRKSIDNIPSERKCLRNNVEATVYEFKRKTMNGKLKVRGLFKTNLFMFCNAIAINFGRIARYISTTQGQLCTNSN